MDEADKFDSNKKYYQFANLRNVLYALSALYSLEMYVYRLIAIQHNEKLFIPAVKLFGAIPTVQLSSPPHGYCTSLISSPFFEISIEYRHH